MAYNIIFVKFNIQIYRFQCSIVHCLTFTVCHRLLQCSQLFFAQFDFVGDLALVHNQFGFHIDEVVVVGIFFDRHIFLYDFGHIVATPIDVDFQTLRFVQLLQQACSFHVQRFLLEMQIQGVR